jgi:hypothetical protein
LAGGCAGGGGAGVLVGGGGGAGVLVGGGGGGGVLVGGGGSGVGVSVGGWGSGVGVSGAVGSGTGVSVVGGMFGVKVWVGSTGWAAVGDNDIGSTVRIRRGVLVGVGVTRVVADPQARAGIANIKNAAHRYRLRFIMKQNLT